jgi:hypothetical protein
MNKTVRELEALFFNASNDEEKWAILQQIFAIKSEQEVEMMKVIYGEEAI